MELPDIDALEEYDVDEHPEDRHRVPTAYAEPDWHDVEMVEGDGTDAIHYAADARILLSYNDE